MALSLGL